MKTLDNLKSWAERIKRDALTLWFACKHPATPWYAKALGVSVVSYALSPIDLIPDFIQVLGYLDDLLLLPASIWLIAKLLPPEVRADCRAQADACMTKQESKPTSRTGAVVIVLIWIAVSVAFWVWLVQSPL